jgi:uncharacterized membrane protein YoaK (UPF0700 family)
MRTFLTDAWGTVTPDRTGTDGPLPPLLVAMTVVTGLVDAFSYLDLGHVFVANMTGNVVFLGFALVGAPGFSVAASLVALASFALGALVGGRLGRATRGRRGRLLSRTVAVQAILVATAVVLVGTGGAQLTSGGRYPLIVVLAVAMGAQNAAARTLAVPDLTTTVLTMTITGIAADHAVAGGTGSRAGRRLVALSAMLVGALVGAAFVLHGGPIWPLVIALVLVVGVGVANLRWTATHPGWEAAATSG